MSLRGRIETLVRVAPPEGVAAYGDETDPRDVGVGREAIASIWRACMAAYRTGLYPALALCIRRHGQVIFDRSLGHARGNAPWDPREAQRVPATPRTLFPLFSASKMVTAMLVHLCAERGLLELSAPVADYLPELGARLNGVTVCDVLAQRAGLPSLPRPFADVSLLERPDELLRVLARARPGRRPASDALTGGFVLGAVIERVTGTSLRAFLRDELVTPLGFDAFDYGVPAARLPEVAVSAFTGLAVLPPLAGVFRRALSLDFVEAVRASNDPRFLTSVVPAANIVATANEASRFMQLLLDGGTLDGTRVFDPPTLWRALAPRTDAAPGPILGLPVRHGMGFVLGRRIASPYGEGTPDAFGHLGFTHNVVYADPGRDLAVALLTSGKHALSPGSARISRVLHAIANHIPRAALRASAACRSA